MKLLRATLTLLAGGALAQALPLLLGPWITRLYTPAEFGQFSFAWTLATNLAVVGCARFEFALPLERDEAGAALLLALCVRVLGAVTVVASVIGAVLLLVQKLEPAGLLPMAVVAGALAQALTLWATRAEAFRALATARVVQWGGAAVLQVAGGLLALGATGLMLGPVIACLVAAAMLARPAPLGGWMATLRSPPGQGAALAAMARKYRDFPLFNTPNAFASALQDSLAMILLTSWAGDASAGYWALALRYLKAPASLVGSALSQTLYPKLVAAPDFATARQLVRHAMLVLGGLAAGLMLVLLTVGPWLFDRVFGHQWQAAGELARALAPYIALHFVASPLAVVTMAWEGQAWALKLAVVGQIMFVAALAAGLRWGGLVGAGWAVSGMMALYFGYYFLALATWKSPRS
ncbi:MAG: lipopolysaccharide biosynthesis protein [Paucibacter sp.]|nr:lipopolysaccharide biosynthesis protein [Roseateles sp.]